VLLAGRRAQRGDQLTYCTKNAGDSRQCGLLQAG